MLTVAARRRHALEEQRREQEWLLSFGLELLSLRDARSVAQCLMNGLGALYGLGGRLISGETAAARTEPGQYILVLESPGMVDTRLLLWRDTGFSPREQQLLERAANAALHRLNMRDAAPAEAMPGEGTLSEAIPGQATPKQIRR